MSIYEMTVYVHMLSAVFFFGYLLFCAKTVVPIVERMHVVIAAERLKEIRKKFNFLGWGALLALVISGFMMLRYRGVAFDAMTEQFFARSFGLLLGVKLLLVLFVGIYQVFIGHVRVPRLIYLNLAVAMIIVALSILLVRTPGILG